LLLRYPPAARWVNILLEKFAFHPARISSFLSSAYGRPPDDMEVYGYLDPLKLPGTSITMIDLINTARNDPPDSFGQIMIPVLGIWGENDTWVPVSQAYRIKEFMPHMTLQIIADSAHCPMETDPDEFAAILLDHIQSIR
jgi:pimeloyl-ACP methyl ester carboxylesterase